MLKNFIIICSIILPLTVFSKDTFKPTKLMMAVEENSIFFELEAPSDSILGFSHLAKSSADKKILKAAEDMWRKEFLSKLIIMNDKPHCEVKEVLFEQILNEGDDEAPSKPTSSKSVNVATSIEAQAKMICSTVLTGEVLTIALRKHFPKIQKLAVEMIGAETRTFDAKVEEKIKLK